MSKIKTVAVVISNYNRFNLLKQTIESAEANTVSKLKIIVVDDASEDLQIHQYLKSKNEITYFQFKERVFIGEVKNKGVELLPKCDYIHFCDNDIFFEPGWDIKLIEVLDNFPDIGIAGGRAHPHHRILERIPFGDSEILSMNNQPGYSLFIRSKDLTKFTPFIASDLGGEDSGFCEKALKKNLKIGVINPPVLHHCGLTSWIGNHTADYNKIIELKTLRPDILIE